MILWILLGVIVVVIGLLHFNHISIDWRSMLSRSMPLDRGTFGIYCFDGKQGTGKTYAMTKFLHYEGKNKQIYSNMTFNGIEYTRIDNLDQLFALADKSNIIIVYDEILNLLNDKSIPRDIRDDLMRFMTQQRKVKNILMTSTQSWLRVPIEFRDFVRIQIKVKTIALGRFGGILIQEFKDADDMKYSQEEQEYVCPRISLKVSKYERKIMQSYDTYEKVKKLTKKLA